MGLPYSGRSAQTWDLMGVFVETLVVRVDLTPELGFDALLGQVRRSVLEAIDHSVVPFDVMVNSVLSTRDASRAALVQTMLVANDDVLDAGSLGLGADVAVSAYEVTLGGEEERQAKFELSPSFAVMGEDLCVELEYSTSLFEARFVTGFLEHLRC